MTAEPGPEAAETGAMGRWGVRFRDSEVEARYWAGRAAADLRQLRLSLLIGSAANMG